LRRDVDRLRNLGYSITSTSGVGGGYSFGAGALPPVMLDDDEGVAVAVALQVMRGAAMTGIEDASQRALAKLERVLPARLQQRVRSMRSSLLRVADAGPSVELDSVATLAHACTDSRRTTFRYRDHDGAESERAVEPHRLVHMDRRWYLVAWDVGKIDWRTFRVDRMAAPITKGDYFVPRAFPGDDLVAYVTRSISSGPYRCVARVRLRAPMEEMRRKISASEGLLERIDDATCRLSTGSNSFESTAAWLARLGAEFEIEEPQELVDEVRRLATRLQRAGHRPTA
jgi:predicted DNA-binding transcriptional regulator YafY